VLFLDGLVGVAGDLRHAFRRRRRGVLIACASVANWVPARFSSAARIGIRVSLGARRGHIVAHFVAEGLLLYCRRRARWRSPGRASASGGGRDFIPRARRSRPGVLAHRRFDRHRSGLALAAFRPMRR
jgi:hypothetical protein